MKLRRGPAQIDDGSVSTGHHRGQGGKADWWLQPVDHRLEPVDHTQAEISSYPPISMVVVLGSPSIQSQGSYLTYDALDTLSDYELS